MSREDASDEAPRSRGVDFIRSIINDDLAAGKHQRVVTRFPPEPNGYLHIGHAKSICLNFGLAREYPDSRCHLRFDDTNPTTEDIEFVESMKADIRWLGFEWDALYHASDYFERFYAFCVELIEKGLAYVDSSSEEEIRERRGTLSAPGTPSPDRERSVAENLDLLARMRAGEFPDGAHVVRAKIDMAAANMKMRDPLLYRIRHAHHYRTGERWCIYPMYDFAHCLSDAVEGITHSLCTLEFENNRELYDWILDNVDAPARPHQYEFARLNLDYTVMSKRKLRQLVEEGHVDGWDDPRMPTIAGLRRRGITPAAIRSFCDLIGVAKANSVVDIGKLEYVVRDDLNYTAPRVMGVVDPIEVVIETYPEGESETIAAPSFPPDVGKPGERAVPFSRVVYIDRSDFAEEPPKGFRRLAPGRKVRLRYAYVITCEGVEKDADGRVVRLRCSHDPDPDAKAKGIIHWVAKETAVPCELRLYDRLFGHPRPDELDDWKAAINPESLEVARGFVEPSVAGDPPGSHYQLERVGYFVSDEKDSREGNLVLNRTVTLRDSWARKQADAEAAAAGADTGDDDDDERGEKASTRPQKRSPMEIRERARAEDPELARRHAAYRELTDDETADILSGDRRVSDFFEEARAAAGSHVGDVANFVKNEVIRELRDEPPAFDATSVARIAVLAGTGEISWSSAKEVFAALAQSGGSPDAIVEAQGLRQVSDDDALGAMIDAVVADNADKVEAYRAGKTGLLGFFVGQVMKGSGGAANPQRVKELLQERLG